MIYNLNKNKSNPVENYHRKLAERKYARDKSLKTRDEEINAESDYIQNTPEFESYTPAYDVNQNITQNVAEKTEEETNKGGFWGGLGYAIEQLGLGLVRSLEGISDYVVGGVAELFGQDEWADEQMRNDWINYDHANEWYNPDGVMQFVGDVASGVGGMLPSIGAAAIPGIGPALSTGMFMTSAAGQSVSDAAKQNEGLSGNEWLYGTGSGLVEGLVEKMSGGTGKLLGKATGKMFGKQIAKSTAGKLAANFVGEGLEEVASDIIDPALRGITGVNSWEEVKRQYGDLPEQLPHTFLVGGTVGSVLGSADRAGRAIQAKGFNNLNAIENASEFKRVEGQNAQAAVKGGKVLDNTALREKLSDNLRKMDSAQRSEFISRNGLENYFNADGGIKSASENSIVSQGYNAQAYSENIANIDKDKLKYKPTANAIRPDIAQAVKDVTLLSDGNGQYVITDGLSDGVNGFYDRESGITYLSGKADAGDVRSYVASHELVHTLEGSRQYERFANTVLKEINSSEALKNKYNIDRYIQNYSAAHDGVAPETLQYIVQTEIVADFAAKEMLTDEAVLRRLINRDRNIVQRILDWVRDKIKILVSKGGDRSNIAFYKKAERQLAKALDNPTGGVSVTAMDNAFKAKETSRNHRYLETENAYAEAQAENEKPRLAMRRDADGNAFVEVSPRVADSVETPKQIAETLAQIVRTKFSSFIDVHGQNIGINQRTAREWLRSKSAEKLLHTDSQAFLDKVNAFENADELLKASKEYVGEAAKHSRKDNFVEFARGIVAFKVGDNGYEADIIVGATKSNTALLYDVVNIQHKEIVADTTDTAQDRRSGVSATINSISNNSEKVNSLREKGGDERNSLKNEITTYGNGMSVTQKPGKYSEVLTKVKTDKLSYGEIAKDAWTNFQINFSDAQTGIVKAGKKLGIEDIDAKTNYVRAAYNAANSMLDENQADISGKRVGDGLKKIFSPVYKKGEEYVKEFYTYLLLKHHADRIKVDKTVLGDLTAAEALQLAVQREIKYPEFKTLAAKVWKYNDNLLQYRVDTGLITAEAAAACRKLYPHYVPTFREGGSSGIGGLSGKYNLAVKSTLKTAKGSTLDIMPIDVIMARQTMEVVRAGRINQLKNSLYDALESRQNYSDMRVAGVERVNKVTEKLRLTAPVKAELYNTLDVDYSTMRDMNNQISFYKDGNRITLDVTPEVFAGFEDFAPNTVYRDKLIEVVAKGNTMFKKLVTSANPFFLVRNFFRDLQDSLFYTKHGIRRFLPSLAKAYKQIATKGEMWNEYLAAGGLSSGLFDYNTGIKRDGTGLKSLAERALNKLEYANMFIEQAPRLAEYMLSRQKGLSVEQSLLDSADVTTNFGRGGKTAKMLNRTVMPFLNPSIQGWSKLVRTVFGKKNVSQWIQLIVRSLLLGIGLTALNDLLNGDDEDYKAVSLRDKENYYLFNIGDGQFLKLPKGRVLSVFGSLYLRGKESAKGNANAWDGYLESAASAVSPVDNFTRTIFSPLTDAATNTTWYGGVIEGRGLQNLSPENRYDESTSEIAKALGKALNYSPKKIHYIIDQYSGVIGDIVLPMTTAKSERGLIASNFTVNTAVSNRYSGEFYDKLDEITYAKNDGDRNAAFKYRYLNDIAGEVSDMYAKRREIENSDLSQQDKSAQSEAVSVLISQTQKSAVKGLDVLDEILNSIDYDKRVAKLTQGFAYRQLTDDEKEKAAVKMYDYYYALAMNKAFGAELDRKQTICNMINDDRIFIYLAHISSLTADTDSNGNTINGSRKKKVETYVDGLPLSSLHKYLLMLLAGYKLGDIGKNKVAGYFNEAALDNSIRENLLSFVA